MRKLLEKTSIKQTALILTILVLVIFLVMSTALSAKSDPSIDDKITISVTKVWEGLQQGQSPEVVTISLVNDDTAATVGSLQFAFSGQTQTFTVPQYALGQSGKLKEIGYSVTEAASDNYTTKISGKADTGFTVTNTIKNDGNGNNGNGNNDACHIFLDINDHQGNAHFITDMTKAEWLAWIDDHGLFAVQKSNNEGSNGWITWHIYATQADADASGNNQIEVVQIRYLIDDVTVTKVWGQGTTPGQSVRVYLLTGADTIDDVTGNTPYITLTAPNWTDSFTRLDPRERYHVVEAPEDIPDGVTSIVSGNVANGFIITNTLDTIDIPVEKVWSNDDLTSHDPIQVQLYANGSPVGQPLTLNEGNEWQDSFDDLAVFAPGGAEIVYTVQEVDAPGGYNVRVSGNQYQGFVITNTLQNDKVDINGTKVWLEDNDDVRPSSVTVYLYADGRLYDTKVVTGTGKSWSWSFTDLPRYREVVGAAPVEIIYTVSEAKIDHYTARVEGTTIYNIYDEDEDENDDEDEDEEEEIEEPDVPLDDTPDVPIIIDEPEMPLDDSPQTGDDINYSLLFFLATIALASLAGFVIAKRSTRQ